ncbi:MAG: arsenite S-adenosylmethyltransferase [Phycisphaerae bacterium]|nr:arsenite S-adenosylmethyltransferase [Phycisphaerae bacterium]MBM91252.1 arsenite S-adenosylmethyltransferase [Phycisphaerae bacterium]HCT44913.1 arsenite S-adenosylmethyltransferase [Phycisphaerales bacterium]
MNTNEAIRDQIRSDYSNIATTSNKAEGTGSSCCAGACGVTESIDPDVLAEQIGYSRAELEALPADANMGLSCGNPNVIANLKEGETVLDLGSGGGFDLFLAGPKVGASGKAIGVDMTAEMIAKARKNLEHYKNTTGLDNVEFRLGEIEHLPVADNSVDVVMSNCVINLALDKQGVWDEIARVLKPGGRVAISDIALYEPLPESVKGIVESWAGCIAGAALVEDLRHQMLKAGLEQVSLTPKPEYVKALINADDPLYQKVAAELPEGKTAADFITSVDISATKPDGCGCADGCCG